MRKVRTTRELRNLYQKEKKEGESRVRWFARSPYIAPENVVNLFLFSEAAQCQKRKKDDEKDNYYEKHKEERKAYQKEYYYRKKQQKLGDTSIIFKGRGRPEKYKTEEARIAARRLQWKEWYEKNKKKE